MDSTAMSRTHSCPFFTSTHEIQQPQPYRGAPQRDRFQVSNLAHTPMPVRNSI